MQHRDHRCPCDLPVVVTCADGQQLDCVIVNISQWGARLARLDTRTPGETLTLKLGPGSVPRDAEVRWSRAMQTGVRFSRPLDGRDMALARRSVAHQSTVKAKGWNLELRELR